jgi:dipeptidyl aminopeptidase/acylaminoacyl peptidase
MSHLRRRNCVFCLLTWLSAQFKTVLFFLIVLLSAGGAGVEAQTTIRQKRLATVADSIRMTRWVDRGYFVGGAPGPVGLFSPDHAHFVVIVKKGDLEHNSNEYSLLLFTAKDVFNHPRPRVLVKMSSTSNRDGVSAVKWLSDNETITFLGETPGKGPQIYRVNIKSNRLEQLTRHPTPIVAYDVGDDGAKIIYEADPPPTKILETEATKRNGIVVTTQYPSDLLLSDSNTLPKATEGYKELFVKRGGEPAARVSIKDYLLEGLPLSISPDGRYAAFAVSLARVPQSWSDYEDRLLHPYIIARFRPGIPFNVQQYVLVNTQTLRVTPLIDAPMSWHNTGCVWAQNSRSIVLSGIYLPLSGTDQTERTARQQRAFVAEVAIPSGQITTVTDKNLRVVGWDRLGQELILGPETSGSGAAEEHYQRSSGGWIESPEAAGDPGTAQRLGVSLDEDMNKPPKIFVTDLRTKQKSVLIDLNPQLGEIELAEEESVTWRASDGHSVTGGLYLPANFRQGVRYPLVIQTHGFDASRFSFDGPFSSVFAAQPLAAAGFVVLQIGPSTVPGEDRKALNTSDEARRQMAAYEGAIDYLDSRGLIDRNRVGIVGFSRTVYHVSYALTHSKYKFAAAILADGFDAGYLNSLFWWDSQDYSSVNGGPSFGSGLSFWLENSPGFNLDKVSAAVRLEYYGTIAPLDAWQFFAGLSNLEKPVDFVWLPFGTHLLVKPWERYASLQGTVDWFNFWLKGQENPSATDKTQNERWEQLRENTNRDSTSAASK